MSAAELRRCLFLDRDGVINESVVIEGKPYPPPDWQAVRYVHGIHSLCAAAREAGWLLIMATNQPDVGRGTADRALVEEIHRHMMSDLQLDGVEVCYDPGGGEPSTRRKPAPGMLLEAAEKHRVDLAASFMIGDRWRDVSCGIAAGCRTVFIDYGYNETLREFPEFTVPDLPSAVLLLRPILNSPRNQPAP